MAVTSVMEMDPIDQQIERWRQGIRSRTLSMVSEQDTTDTQTIVSSSFDMENGDAKLYAEREENQEADYHEIGKSLVYLQGIQTRG